MGPEKPTEGQPGEEGETWEPEQPHWCIPLAAPAGKARRVLMALNHRHQPPGCSSQDAATFPAPVQNGPWPGSGGRTHPRLGRTAEARKHRELKWPLKAGSRLPFPGWPQLSPLRHLPVRCPVLPTDDGAGRTGAREGGRGSRTEVPVRASQQFEDLRNTSADFRILKGFLKNGNLNLPQTSNAPSALAFLKPEEEKGTVLKRWSPVVPV